MASPDWLGFLTGASSALPVFYVIGIVAGLVLILQTALMLVGFDGHHDVDASGAMDGEIGFFSVRSVVAFFVGFGWTGVLATKAGWDVLSSTAAGLGVGLAFMAVIYGLIRVLYAQRASGNLRLENAVGQAGRVYVGIPADGAAGGQVQVTVQGALRTLPAITRGGTAIASGSTIIVRETVPPDLLVVEKL